MSAATKTAWAFALSRGMMLILMIVCAAIVASMATASPLWS